MMDPEQEKARIRAVVEWWIEALGLNPWHIDVYYTLDTLGPDVAARTETKWEYMKATIEFCLPMVCTQEDWVLDELVCHECIHILTAEMEETDGHADHVERAVTGVAKAMHCLQFAMWRPACVEP